MLNYDESDVLDSSNSSIPSLLTDFTKQIYLLY